MCFWKKYGSYRLRVSLSVAVMLLIPTTAFSIVSLSNMKANWKTDALMDYSQFISVNGELLNNTIQGLCMKALYICNDMNIRKRITQIEEISMEDKLTLIDDLYQVVDVVTTDNTDITVRWYLSNSSRNYGGVCYTMSDFSEEFVSEEEMLEKILLMKNGNMLVTVRKIERGKEEGVRPTLCVYMNMNDLKGDYCLLEMSIPVEKVLHVQDTILPEGSIMGLVLQHADIPQGYLLLEDNQKHQVLIEEYVADGYCGGYTVIANHMDTINGRELFLLLPDSYVTGIITKNIILFYVVIVFMILVVVTCSYVVAKNVTAYVSGFLERVNKNLDVIIDTSKIPVELPTDFVGIESKISQLIQNTQNYYALLEEYKEENSRLELELLQMRFNPHFLYNTLSTIRYQLDDVRLQRSIDSLIHYYRIVLNKGHLHIRIEEEIQMIHEYLRLEKFMLHCENIQYRFEIAEDVKPFFIIKHLLQPIVENALEHGVRENEHGGMISIRAWLEAGDIVFEIADDGPGMTQEQLERILMEPEQGSSGGGYGVYNVQQRIEIYYGEGYGLLFHSKPMMGTKVTIRIPQSMEC